VEKRINTKVTVEDLTTWKLITGLAMLNLQWKIEHRLS
jgi:hypothetical protein